MALPNDKKILQQPPVYSTNASAPKTVTGPGYSAPPVNTFQPNATQTVTGAGYTQPNTFQTTSAPVQTTAAPAAPQNLTKYQGGGNPYNEISYLKNMYEAADSTAGQKAWAAKEAQKYYKMLSPQDRQKFQNMNATAMANYLKYQNQQEQAMGPIDESKYKWDEQIDFDKYRTDAATIDDIAKKYGFDFSREYAKRQAEAEAQAKRNANSDANRRNEANRDLNLEAIDNNLMNMADSLDRNYYQQFMQQAQGQVNNGLNAGIAADQDLRLAMNRQAEMGSAYRDANLGRMQENQRFSLDDVRLAEELGLINQQALAREDSLFNERLQLGFDNAMQLSQFNQADNLAQLQAALQQRGQNIDQNMNLLDAALRQRDQTIGKNQADRQFEWDQYQFNNMNATDSARLAWEKEMYNKMSATDRAQLDWQKEMYKNMSATDRARLDWERYQFNNMSASDREANKLAYDQLAEQKRQFGTEQAWRQYTYKNMSATDKAQFDQQSKQFGEEMAWKYWETKYTSEMALSEAQASAGFPAP